MQSWAQMYSKRITHRNQLLYTKQLPSLPATLCTDFSLIEMEGLLCMRAIHTNLRKDKYLPHFSAVFTNEKFAASCLWCVRGVKGRKLGRVGACSLTIAHRQGLYPSVVWVNSRSSDMKAVPCQVGTKNTPAESRSEDESVAC